MSQNFTRSRAIERQALAAFLRTIAIGEIATYDMINAAVECPDITTMRSVIYSVLTELRDEDGILFHCEPRIGYRRLTDIEMATSAPERRRRKAHRQIITGLKEVTAIRHPENLPDGERLQMNGHINLLSALKTISTHKALKLVVAATESLTNITVQETLDALRSIK